MKLFRNTALALVVVLALSMLISSLMEWNAMTTEIHALESTIRVASEHAIGEFEITQFSGFDDNLGDSHNASEYKYYLKQLEIESKEAMRGDYVGSDMEHIISFLGDELADYKSGDTESVLSPFAFSLTFLEEDKLTADFNETVSSLIRHNYNQPSCIQWSWNG